MAPAALVVVWSAACGKETPTATPVMDADAEQSRLYVDRVTGVAADGVDKANIRVELKNRRHEALVDREVMLMATPSDVLLAQAAAFTDADGVVTGTVAATRLVTVTISAIVDPVSTGLELADHPTVEFVLPAGSEAPVLGPLRLGTTTSTTIEILQPTLSTAGFPTPTISAFVGVDGTIAVANGVVTGASQGPVDAATAGVTFHDLGAATAHRVIVVAQNLVASSTAWTLATTFDLPMQLWTDHTPVNQGCTKTQADRVTCALTEGTAALALKGGASQPERLVVTNGTGTPLQLDVVTPTAAAAAEVTLCVFLDEFARSQTTLGTGEVGCVRQLSTTYPTLRWRAGTQTGLAVQPGATLYIATFGAPYVDHRVQLTTRALTNGVLAARQPKTLATYPCSGVPTTSTWSVWKNYGQAAWVVGGASIDAYSPTAGAALAQVTSACVVLQDDQLVERWRSCSNTGGVAANVSGNVMFVAQNVLPSWSIAVQATNTCPSGRGSWGYNAYLWIW